MQSGNREYIGRNEFWTPSTIGITQSLIDTSINKIELKDNTADLFTVENNKLKSNIQMICDDPTDNEDIVNKKYVDDKDNEVQRNMSSKFITPTQANRMFASKSDIPTITFSHSYLYTLTSYHNQYVYINNIKSGGEGSVITINLPTSVTGPIRYVSLNFNVWTAAIGGSASELDQLCCKLAIKPEKTYKDIDSIDGPAMRGSKIASCCYRFNFSQFFTNIIDNKLYLRFSFIETGAIEKTDEDMKNDFYITYNDAYPEMELTVVGFKFI